MQEKTTSIDDVTVTHDTSVRPFNVGVPPKAIDDLHQRIEAMRWPTKAARRKMPRRACKPPFLQKLGALIWSNRVRLWCEARVEAQRPPRSS